MEKLEIVEKYTDSGNCFELEELLLEWLKSKEYIQD